MLKDLQTEAGDRVTAAIADITDSAAVDATFAEHGPFDAVFHLAAQVAVTWAMQDPRRDFEVNALGSFNVIDALRRYSPMARAIYMSSNKVYGPLEGLAHVPSGERTLFADFPEGVDESHPLDPLTPYGVSKATGESYFRDAARTYDIASIVLRASCIYGPRQSQQEDQGWVSWFASAVTSGQLLRIFGDGRTTRDMLFIDDLVDLYLRILDGSPPEGAVMNVGGGAGSARSLLEVVRLIEELSGSEANLEHYPERPGDQKVFITSCKAAARLYDWKPTTPPEIGLKKLLEA